MDLEFTISAQEAGSALQVEIADNRATITGLASGRKLVFEGVFGDVRVKLLPALDQAAPVLPEVAAEVEAEAAPESPVTDTAAVAPVEAKNEADPQLFKRLVALRKQISTEVKLPPFIIFHDNTLKEMCRRLPADLEALGTISGVGEAKLAKYGARFVEAIREYLGGKEG
jgi:superfamily II DNA helicase RecQ